MSDYQQIDSDGAKALIEQGATVADIRDLDYYRRNHIRSARHLDSHSLQQFTEESDLDLPLLVYCHHGHASQSAAQLLYERGFDEVYSLIGGFEAWQKRFPDQCEPLGSQNTGQQQNRNKGAN